MLPAGGLWRAVWGRAVWPPTGGSGLAGQPAFRGPVPLSPTSQAPPFLSTVIERDEESVNEVVTYDVTWRKMSLES